MSSYADSSFLGSLYLLDRRYAVATEYMRTNRVALPLTYFGAFELRNAVRAAVVRGTSTADEVQGILALIEQHLADGRLVQTSCDWEEVYLEAENLSARHTLTGGHRALDVLHVAVALVLGCTVFLTFDQRQAGLARLAGLTVHP